MATSKYSRRVFGRRVLAWSGAAGLVLVVGSCDSSDDGGESHGWSYEGSHGPERWASLSDEYATCGSGTEQSPIDLGAGAPADGAVAIHWEAGALEAENNGHTLHVGVEEGSWVEIDGERFELLQFHFHAPSEHTLNGAPLAMETHFVHQSAAGELAVIGVMHAVGEENAALEPVLAALDLDVGESRSLAPLDLTAMLPAERAMYRYAGSLTTPPCSEGVRWHVLQATTSVSEAQVERYQAVYGMSARPVQPLGEREVLEVAARP